MRYHLNRYYIIIALELRGCKGEKALSPQSCYECFILLYPDKKNPAEPYFFRRDRAFDPFGKFPIKSDRVLSIHSVL